MYLLNDGSCWSPKTPDSCLVLLPVPTTRKPRPQKLVRGREGTRIPEFGLSFKLLALHPADSFQRYKQAFEYKQLKIAISQSLELDTVPPPEGTSVGNRPLWCSL